MLEVKKHPRRCTLYLVGSFFTQVFLGSLLSKLDIAIVSKNLTVFVYAAQFIITLVIYGRMLISDIKGLSFKKLSTLAFIGVITFFAIALSGIVLTVLKINNANQSAIDSHVTQYQFATMFAIVIMAPIAEEVTFRYCIWGLLKKHIVLAHSVTALLFGFMHVWVYILIDGDISQFLAMLPYIIMSLGFSILYKRTENIWYPIILHMVINYIAST